MHALYSKSVFIDVKLIVESFCRACLMFCLVIQFNLLKSYRIIY